MRNDFLAHSKKGTTWKSHKYIRKEGQRYFYKEKVGNNIADEFVETPDLQDAANQMDNIDFVKKFREAIDIPIWSPNKEEKTLVSEGQKVISDLFKKEKQVAKR